MNGTISRFDDIDLSEFGKHGGDDLPNNEYDEKEVETLNNLIASETSAVEEYLDGAKNTNNETLRRLYADIGSEERFHSEQLMYAKSIITGETYTPRDPEVKKEYDELVEMGMDEETALTTIQDRHAISSPIAESYNIAELIEDVEILEQAILSNLNNVETLSNINESVDNSVDVFMETFVDSYFFTEGFNTNVDNAKSKDGGIKKPHKSPLALIFAGYQSICKLIKTLISKIKAFCNKIKNREAEKFDWIKRHGIKGLFEPGISMYFYDDRNPNVVSTEPIRYAELLYDLTISVAKFIKLDVRGFDKETASYQRNYQKIVYGNSISQGLDIMKRATFTKTKIVVTDNNEQALAQIFFGYKISKAGGKSLNIYTQLNIISDQLESFVKITEMFFNKCKDLEKDPNSIYYTDRAKYDKALSGFKDIMRCGSKFSSALASDLSVVMRLNNGILEDTSLRDEADSKHYAGYSSNRDPYSYKETPPKATDNNTGDIEW